MESKLRSRKFWMVIAVFVAGLWATFTGTEVDPETLLSAGGIIITWLGVQGWADKATAESGISFERRLYQANMEAAMAQFQNMQGSQGVEVPPFGPDPTEFESSVPPTYPPLESV